VDFYTQPRRAHHHRLPAWVTSHAVDGYFAKKQYSDAVVALRRHPIPKRRGDADGRVLCTGPHPTRRGAHRQDDGKGHWQDLSRVEALGTLAAAEHVHLYPAVVWHVTRKRKLRVVVLLNRKAPATPRDLVLASTELALDGHKRLELYGARFQLECLCRDSTQVPGLTDGQARAEAPRSCHFNAALATRNLVRAEDLNAQAGAEPRVFSMASGKPCPFNERLLDLFIEQ
jgi:hypothetical protein